MQFNFINTPSSRSYAILGADPQIAIRNAILEGKEIIIFADLSGARNIHTTIQYDEHVLSVNPEIKGYKLFPETLRNSFSGEVSTRYYFKKLKSQDQSIYEKYLLEIIKYVEQSLQVKLTQQEVKVYTRAFN